MDHADGHSVPDLSREAAQNASSLHGSKTLLTGGQEAQVTEICFAGWKPKWNGIVRSRRANLPDIVCWQAGPGGASAGSRTACPRESEPIPPRNSALSAGSKLRVFHSTFNPKPGRKMNK